MTVSTQPTAAELLDAARAGDVAARDELVTRHLDTVRAVCCSRLRSPHDVADATQETFLRALARLDQVRDADALAAWLRAIAVRVCADQGRHLQRSLVVADPVGDAATEEPGPDELLLADEEASRLHATLATLGSRDRKALWLRDAVGLPVAHIAADLGLTEGSARVLLARARTRLRTAYEGAAAVAAVGLLRVRGRVASLGGLDARVAFAAQLAIVAVAVGAAVPGAGPSPAEAGGVVGTAPVAPAAPADRSAAAATSPAPVTADTPATTAHAGAPSRPPATPGDGRPPVVDVGGPPPDGPGHFGIAASDGEGEVAGLELWGGPADVLTDEGSDDGAPGDAPADEDDEPSRLPLGPLEVAPGDLGSRLPG